jgi:hypothetical protein
MNGPDINFIDPSTNAGGYEIVGIQLTSPGGFVILD